MPKTARDIMTTDLITVTPSTPIREFARLCSEDHISGAPVLNMDDSIAGVVSKTDLLERLLQADPRHAEEHESLTDIWMGEDATISEIMVEDVFMVAPDTPLDGIAAEMAERRIHRVFVVDGGRCAGLITSLDLLAHFGG
ncbi:MAG: CBS domain-containing protein [Planctomycetota bacterium]|jgi:CBS domain-containing protein